MSLLICFPKYINSNNYRYLHLTSKLIDGKKPICQIKEYFEYFREEVYLHLGYFLGSPLKDNITFYFSKGGINNGF
jgi:hypothetical protein